MRMYLILLSLFFISVYWIIYRKKHEELTPLEKLLTVTLIIGGIFGIIATIPTIINLLNDPKIWSNPISQIVLLISLVIMLMLSNVLIAILLFRVSKFLISKLTPSSLTVSILEESRKFLGGELLFDVKFSGLFKNGYFSISMRSPYWEEETITIRYDKLKKLGLLWGNYKDRPIKLKCNIPKHFSSGEYDVKVEIYDVTNWLFSIRTTERIKQEKLKVIITETK